MRKRIDNTQHIARQSTKLAAALLIVLATVSVAATGACGNDANRIQRVEHDTLPTPTRGYFYPVDDDSGQTQTDPLDGQPGDFGFVEAPDFDAPPDDFISMEAISADPELAELIAKIESGAATDADYEQLESLMMSQLGDQFAYASSGQIITGTISAINGNTLSITVFPDADQDDYTESGESSTPDTTSVTVTDGTQILLVSALAPTDIKPGEEVNATAERNEEGRIRARTLSILNVDEDSPFAAQTAFGRGRPGPGFGGAPFSTFGTGPRGRGGGGGEQIITEDGESVTIEIVSVYTESSGALSAPPVIGANVAGIPASGRVTKVEGQIVHVEAMQGPLRITIDHESITARGRPGTAQDLRTGLAVAATLDADDNAITIAIGPADLINLDESDRFQWLTP